MDLNLWAVAESAATRRAGAAGAETVGYAAGLAMSMLAGSVFVAVKLVSDEMPPWTMCFFRVLISALVLLPLVARHHAAMLAFLRARGLEAAVIGALGLGLTQGVLFTALHGSSVISVGIVFATAPMITLALARLVIGERMSAWQAIGSAVAFAGIVVISVQGSMARLLGLQIDRGDLLAIVSAAMFASYTVLLKRAKFDLPRLPLLVVLLAFGSLAAFPFFLLELARGEHANLTTDGYAALLYCGVIGGAVMYLLFNLSIELLGAARAGTLIYTQMIFVALFAWLLLSDPIEWYHAAGGALVIAGVLLVTLKRPRPVDGP